MVNFHTRGTAMTAERTVSLSFRVTPAFARLLEQAAALEHRSKTNLVETLVLQFCQAKGLPVDDLAVPLRTAHAGNQRPPRGA